MNNNRIREVLIFIILFLGMALFQYIPLSIFNININNMSDKMKILYQFACDLGFMIIIFLGYHKSLLRDIKDIRYNLRRYLEKMIKYYLVGLLIMYGSNFLIGVLFSSANANNEEMVRDLIDLYPLYMIFSVSLYAPAVEEIIFRKSIKDVVLSFGNNKICKYLYVIMSGLIFASMHVLGIVTSNLDYLYIIPYLGLGSAFALLYYETDNIFTTIIMHSLHNTIAIILYLMVGV